MSANTDQPKKPEQPADILMRAVQEVYDKFGARINHVSFDWSMQMNGAAVIGATAEFSIP